ncbi:hypothetical protein SXCC_02200 [Gluconacetobacter sp. SXCC-1]|nr:hypothetical protein SXCC_02200 [Gluconacetobacter sp. SXCC-1]SAY48294.1 hypothetical protein KRIGEM_01241 [Komagataeibacter rhaeticus]
MLWTGRTYTRSRGYEIGLAVLGLAVMSGCACTAYGCGVSWADLSEATASIFRY